MHNRRVNTANLKPFKKGPDPRRNPTGGVCKERAAWEQKFRNALAEKTDPLKLAQVLADAAMRAKRPWAIEIILDRLIGKVAQPVGLSGEVKVPIRLIYENADTDTGKS